MISKRAILAFYLMVAACLISVILGAPRNTVKIDKPLKIVKVLQEDDPGWNCHTMGNRSCVRKES